ncbi:hypothetical protein IWW40_005649 [Coemansia sp. RSA 1250]|nr:hypothetical protein IWW40_005649 [Coemansia sp. RSA 1250]
MSPVNAVSAADRSWATQQIATIVGASKEDAEPLAEFLLGIEGANELQGQLLDMLGESPLALDFASALIAKRFPVEDKGVQETPPLPPRQQPKSASSSNVVAYRKGNPDDIAYFEGTSSSKAKQPTTYTETPAQEQPHIEYKSQRQLKRERKEQAQREKEAAEKRRQRANRKRVKCECQATEHPLLTNCLTCGRIICDSEGPGPCMFCGSEVDSPDQQLQQHMQRLISRSQSNNANNKHSPKPPVVSTPGSYSMKAGGATQKQQPTNAQLLWADTESKQQSSTSGTITLPNSSELSESEYLDLAFQALGIDHATADAASIQEAESWVKATRRKERLLNFDRTAAQRTRLIDQSSDFDPDATGKWMSPEEKAEAQKRQADRLRTEEEREARLQRGMRVLRLNFSNASVDIRNEDDVGNDDIEQPAAPAAKASVPAPDQRHNSVRPKESAGAFAHNPLLLDAKEPQFVLAEKTTASKKPRASTKNRKDDANLTDKVPAADIDRRRLMLRIQTDMTDTVF